MTRKEQKIAAIEKKLTHVGEPSGLIIYPPAPDEPKRSIKCFEVHYPYYDQVLLFAHTWCFNYPAGKGKGLGVVGDKFNLFTLFTMV